jgi:hypothetical protein
MPKKSTPPIITRLRKLFRAFEKELDDAEKDDWYDTDRGFAHTIGGYFLQWCKENPGRVVRLLTYGGGQGDATE